MSATVADQPTYDVLVVGLGPVGAVLACLAAARGLRVVAVERDPAPFALPRAAVFDHEIMRIFQSLGVAERVAPLCRVPERYQFRNGAGALLLDFPLGGLSPVSGWRESYLLHQPSVEAVLRERLRELGVELRLGGVFVELAQDPLGVTACFDFAGTRTSLRARVVVGCDGARSQVREALGIDLFDYQFDEPWLVIDAIADQPGDLPITCEQIADPRRPATYLAMSPPRFRWEFMMKPGETQESLTQPSALRALLAPWNCFERLRLERCAVYRFHGLVARQWRQGRVLLAGDAAHQMPPFAGQGMCSGIRDAANLAWKLAAWLGGEAGETLLDSYQAEREPHVRAIIETAIAMGRVVCLQDEAAAAARDAMMLERRASGEQDVQMAYPDLVGGCLTGTKAAGALFAQGLAADGSRLDDVLGPGAWLIGHAPLVAVPKLQVVTLDSPLVAPFAPQLAAWLAAHEASAVLVRPDRHVFGTGSQRDLLTSWRQALFAA